MFEFDGALFFPLQELDIIRGGQSPPEDKAGQVGQLLLYKLSSPFFESTVSAAARHGTCYHLLVPLPVEILSMTGPLQRHPKSVFVLFKQ